MAGDKPAEIMICKFVNRRSADALALLSAGAVVALNVCLIYSFFA
jgi:hypothetical protein